MCYTNRQIDNRCKKLAVIAEQINALEAAAEAIKTEIKADMDADGRTEIITGNFTVRYATITQNKLDSTALKEALPDVYKQYVKQSTYRRFTVA